MMREQRGRHFDPVLLDAFMEVLGRSGPDAREPQRSDPPALVESTLETFATALERGDAEMAEGGDRDGDRGRHHADDAARRGHRAGAAAHRRARARRGEIDAEREHRATTITRRVLATLYRYMTGGTEPTRERVLLAGVEGDEHTLGLQMVHDQLAAAGFHTIFDTDLSRRAAARDESTASPPTWSCSAPPRRSPTAARAGAARRCARATPTLPIVLGGPAVGGSLPRERRGMRVLERIDESVAAVEDCSLPPAPRSQRRVAYRFPRMSPARS